MANGCTGHYGRRLGDWQFTGKRRSHDDMHAILPTIHILLWSLLPGYVVYSASGTTLLPPPPTNLVQFVSGP
jgi:hypothetical protein